MRAEGKAREEALAQSAAREATGREEALRGMQEVVAAREGDLLTVTFSTASLLLSNVCCVGERCLVCSVQCVELVVGMSW